MQSFTETIQTENPESILFIDGSYFCFHRYHSIMRWWKNAYPETVLEDPFKNEMFVQKFKKTFVETVSKLTKQLQLKNHKPFMIVGKDCKRENIWRNSLYPSYKGTRVKDDDFMGGPFFKMVYDEGLFQLGGVRAILKHPHLEADDCIAISVMHILKVMPDTKINIITSDKDYLQLAGPNVNIFNLAYKNITENTLGGSAEADLFCKIVMGDTSDNISSVLRKCGPKTALKCYQDREYFNERMKTENAYEKYELNQNIIDFTRIPSNLVDEFMQDYSCVNT
jgi:5'-3' exonuclease